MITPKYFYMKEMENCSKIRLRVIFPFYFHPVLQLSAHSNLRITPASSRCLLKVQGVVLEEIFSDSKSLRTFVTFALTMYSPRSSFEWSLISLNKGVHNYN